MSVFFINLNIDRKEKVFFMIIYTTNYYIHLYTSKRIHRYIMYLYVYAILNNLHPDLVFKLETCASTVDFLDLKVITDNGYLSTDIFYKTTDSKEYVPQLSLTPSSSY